MVSFFCQNKAKALKVLCAKLYEMERYRIRTDRSKLRMEQVLPTLCQTFVHTFCLRCTCCFLPEQFTVSKYLEQIGSGDRSERIRTYNFPQGRVTDHRVGITYHSISDVMEGESLDVFIDALLLQQEMNALASFSST